MFFSQIFRFLWFSDFLKVISAEPQGEFQGVEPNSEASDSHVTHYCDGGRCWWMMSPPHPLVSDVHQNFIKNFTDF